MATRYWVGRAASVQQVVHVEFSAVTASETYSVTINGKTISATAASTSLADLIDALITAWEASAEPEHQECTAAEHLDGSSALDGLKLTVNTAGVPVTITADATGTPTATVSDDTAASGPNFWTEADNWDGGTLPAAGDTLVIRNTAVPILYGLTDTTNYARLDIEASFTGSIGLPETNANGYPEYRTRYLTLGDGSGSLALNIGAGVGNHASHIYIDVADAATTLTVLDSQSGAAGYPVQLLNLKSTSTAAVYGGGVYFDDSTTGTIASLKVVARQGTRSQPQVETSSNITATAVEVSGGTVTLGGSGTTLTARDGAQVTVDRAAAIGTVTVGGRAQLLWASSGGIATLLTVESEGKIDFGRAASTKTVAAAKLSKDGDIADPLGVVTWTAGVELVGCRLRDVRLDLGVGVTVTPS